MANRYKQIPSVASATRFNKSPMAQVEFSKMRAPKKHYTTFNGGDIVPIAYWEILPHDTFDINVEFVNRLQTALRPTMGDLVQDIYFFWVPNRIINESWKNLQGENTSGVWAAPEISLAPLLHKAATGSIQIPVGSVADYYGFPTQAPLKADYLKACNDLKFRGYVEIFNTYYRSQDYQPPVNYSKLNVYQGFLLPKGALATYDSSSNDAAGSTIIPSTQPADGSSGKGAIVKAVVGDGGKISYYGSVTIPSRLTSFSALDKPLKANKFHDAFTSALPAPQKGSAVTFSVSGELPVYFDTSAFTDSTAFPSGHPLTFLTDDVLDGKTPLILTPTGGGGKVGATLSASSSGTATGTTAVTVSGTNLTGTVNLADAIGISINDLRTSIATQQVLEILARGGSRYVSVLANMFDIETATPFVDIPLLLGHVRRNLDMYQVAQTNASIEGETPQGTLTAYGYTSNGGKGFTRTFIEHGYIHAFVTVRQHNAYSTYFAPDNFRLNTLDFYMPPLANIGEQPLPTKLLNPFVSSNSEGVIGYQEAWWEYRNEIDSISGEFRSGINGSLDVWHYGDNANMAFETIDGNWLKSNAEEVINRTIAVTSDLAHQFKACFVFDVTKQRPMPTYSVPGLDTI